MTRIIQSLDQVAADYDVLFCDLWGCLHNGKRAYPAAVAALQRFRAGGGQVVLMTNAPRPAKFVARHLAHLQVPEDCWDLIVSSGDAAQDAMFSGAVGHEVWAIAPDKDDAFFTDRPAEWAEGAPIRKVALEDAQGIVCTGPFDEDNEQAEDYRDRLTVARDRGLKLLCANPDIVVDMGDRRIICAGALARLYEQMGGTSLYFGKPHAPIYDLARRRAGLGPDTRALAVGDGIDTDILGAMDQRIDSVFITGGLAHDQFGADVEAPEQALLDPWLKGRDRRPTYAIGRLR
ncbi:TIGR01459 family HAD-type hydrolase [uncultured Paracoccus sp.]|uniref:TIGR01459 family HAD-type hydrolase n=1 Tax=uncultured Paracoccus sp. TaxID=189685 RepID=UPI0025E1D75C|nr:TIGR01459 family HAD-type hydrolase [uncultured Paracoccus sp.]